MFFYYFVFFVLIKIKIYVMRDLKEVLFKINWNTKTNKKTIFLVNSFELDVENKRTISRYVISHSLIAIAHIWRHNDLTLATDSHVLEADVPAANHLATAQTELERLSACARVELFAVLLQFA